MTEPDRSPPPLIRHVRYEDYFALVSDGVGNDLLAYRRAVDALVHQMGDPHWHHVLFDLRHATVEPLPEILLVEPLPEILLVEAMSYLQKAGLGIRNRVAVVVGGDDRARQERAATLERIAVAMQMEVRSFQDHGDALDWLSSGG
jgi:hypothetical protein